MLAVHFAGNSHSFNAAIFGEELLEVVLTSVEMNVRNVDLSFFVHGPLTILSCRRVRNLDLEIEAVAYNVVVQLGRSNGLVSRLELDVTEPAMCVVL